MKTLLRLAFASVVEIVERLVNQSADVSGWKGLREEFCSGATEHRIRHSRERTQRKSLTCAIARSQSGRKFVESYPDVVGFTSDLGALHFVLEALGLGVIRRNK